MKSLRMFLLIVFAIVLPSTVFAQYGYCTATNGRRGECISTSQCKVNGGSSDPANLCPGDNSIQVWMFNISVHHFVNVFAYHYSVVPIVLARTLNTSRRIWKQAANYLLR
ncbi:unnamed protein product [Rotaria sp. Silwood2]|nr:unnamed protein product [Rotaria sp. Silwood2]